MTTLGFDVFWRDHGASRGMRNLGDDTHRTAGRFSTFKTVAAGAGLAVGAALFKLGKDSVGAFTEAQSSQQKLQDAFARFPKLADVSIGSLRALNVELHNKTRFDDDAFASGQAVLAQFGLTGKQLTELTPLLADYAAKTGKDLPTAAGTLGKAFLGNTRALKAIGIEYKMTGDKGKDMAAITDLIRQKVGGFAEKEGKTGAGQAEILRNRFGDLEEEVGSKLLPTLLKLTGVLLSTIGFIQRNAKTIIPLVEVLGTFVVTLLAAAKATVILNAALRLMGINATIALGPIGLIIAAVAAFAVGLIYAYKHSETFRKIVDATFRVVKTVIMGTFNWVKDHWPLLLGILTGPIGLATILIIRNWKKIHDGLRDLVGNIRDFFRDLPGRIVGWLGALGRTLYGRGRALIFGFWRGIKDVWSSTIQWFKDLPSKILSALGIHSPPDWAIEAGKHIMAGILKGVVPGGQELLRFAKNTVANLQAGFGGGGLLGRILAGGGGTGAGGNAVQIGQRMAASVGWTGTQWRALYDLWNNESGWNPFADNPTSTAFGIPQFIASTARAYGVYGSTDPARQIAAGMQYISDVYGDPIHAWAAWTGRHPHWYDAGGMATGSGFFAKRTLAPERILSPAQTRSFDRLVRVLDRGGGATIVNVTVNTAGVVGMTKMDLENTLVATLNRVAGQGRLNTAVRLAAS